MFKAIMKIMLFLTMMIIPLLSSAQHNLYFYIPECPNPVGIISEVNNDFTIYPNPANNILHISFNETIQSNNYSTLKIFSSNGNMVFETRPKFKSAFNSPLDINISQFKQGLYYIQYSDNKSIISKKFIITK